MFFSSKRAELLGEQKEALALSVEVSALYAGKKCGYVQGERPFNVLVGFFWGGGTGWWVKSFFFSCGFFFPPPIKMIFVSIVPFLLHAAIGAA